MKTELITVPVMFFEQGDIFEGGEYPIHVKYYNGSVELVQNGNSILITEEYLDKFFKDIKGNLKDAKWSLDNRK